MPFAAKYYSIKISSLSIDHLSLQLILSFLDYLQSDRSNAANTRNQRLAVIKSLAKMIRLMYPQKREIADIILAIPQKKSQKKIVAFLYIEEIFATYEAVDLKKPLGFRDYTIFHLLADSGARATEIATLNLDYFNPTQKTRMVEVKKLLNAGSQFHCWSGCVFIKLTSSRRCWASMNLRYLIVCLYSLWPM